MEETLVIPKSGSTPSGNTSESTGLPADILRQAAKRLRWAALIYAGTYFLAYFPPHLILSLRGETAGLKADTIVAVSSILFALFVYLVAKPGRMRIDRLVNLGLTFEVIASLGISFSIYWMAFDAGPSGGLDDLQHVPMGISWVCVWIVVFPMVVPTTLKKTFVAAFLSACTSSLVLSLSWLINGLPAFFDGSRGTAAMIIFFVTYPSFICVAMALVTSAVVFNLGRKLREARRMGSYQLVERLGQGGMGEVWRAKHRFLARPAAIKLIKPEALGDAGPEQMEALVRRFEREAQATAALTSPHTVALFDFGITRDRVFYTVMELLDGFDLQTLVSRFGPLPAERVVHILIQACSSLGEAHGKGLVHRDIKPANLILGRSGVELDHLKVLDFGLVKHVQTQEKAAEITQEGVSPGTPQFMAPEQAMGSSKADHRVDIYGLGCVAYWLLTGTHLFEGDTPIEVVAQHIQAVPEPPSSRVELPIPAELERIVLDCLAKKPENRVTTVRELARRLAAVPLERPWDQERAERWWATNAPSGSNMAPGTV